jgi:hypothetical protein
VKKLEQMQSDISQMRNLMQKSINKNKVNTLYLIHKQLLQIRKLMKEEIAQGEYCVNYRISETDYKLLSKNDLVEYLIETEIHNKKYLEDINLLVIEIIKLWNEDFQSLNHKELKNGFVHRNEEKGQFLSASLDFHCILLTDEIWQHFSPTDSAKTFFLENYYNSHYQLATIVTQCAAILDIITLHYPETYNEEKLEPVDAVEKMKQKIHGFFNDGYEFAFIEEADYKLIVTLLANYFADNEIKLPEKEIRLKMGCKTRLASILKDLHNTHGRMKLVNDTQFFDVVKLLSPYKNEPNLYKTIGR